MNDEYLVMVYQWMDVFGVGGWAVEVHGMPPYIEDGLRELELHANGSSG